MDIFISYSKKDEIGARNLAKQLADRGKNVFFAPLEMKTGDNFKEEIRKALLETKEVFVLANRDSLDSKWVTMELNAAWVLGKRIVPILYRGRQDELPALFEDIHVRDITEIDTILEEFDERQRKRTTPAKSEFTFLTKPRTLLFDIDGTVLKSADSMDKGVGLEFTQCLKKLRDYGFQFVFITGNDIRLQKQRVLDPIKNLGLGPSVFCFSDGGSRAFEFNNNNFEEISGYSKDTIITTKQVELVKEAFDEIIPEFVNENDELLRTNMVWSERTLDYLDLKIFPLKPSFVVSKLFDNFCDEITKLSHDSSIKHTSFKLIKDRPSELVIRALGKDPGFELSELQNLITHKLMYKKEYMELSKPEIDVRGGTVTTQIAIKPFNNHELRKQARIELAKKLEEKCPGEFSVLLGGRTTIDIQRKGVDKAKAIRYLISENNINSKDMIYFGDEFDKYLNDRFVAEMSEAERPAMIVNVGKVPEKSFNPPFDVFLEDGNGPTGTLNYLKFLLNELAIR